ncbi:MAG: chorismate lyase [Tatlockia sp.]|nr:chorismate lyase [Tatlockia sp.]
MDKLLKINANPPNNLKSWLSHNDSLTQKLKDQSGNAEIQVLNQDWAQPGWWDKYLLGLIEPIIQRNILMFSHKKACWFARTIIPNSSYQQCSLLFNRLSEEPLSVILFSDPTIKRILLQNYAINEHSLEYYWLPETVRTLAQHSKLTLDETGMNIKEFWVRFSIFTIAEISNFYLIEILLPGLNDCAN